MIEDPRSPSALPPGSLVDGRFRIEAHLAQGGMGDIYRAEHVLMKRPVALKLLRPEVAALPEMATRFQREAQLVSQLDHPFIVRVFDFGRTDEGLLFLSMELVEGTSLEARLQQLGPWSPLATLRLIRHVCSALTVAHGRGVVHRDLKPDNILLTARPPPGITAAEGEDGFPKILDFGIARLADSPEGSTITRMGMTLGTPDYLSPEQALAQPLDARTDLYSLSIVAFRMLAGRLPFESDDPRQLLSHHINTEPPPLIGLRPGLAAVPALVEVIRRGMAKDRSQRFESAAALAAALTAAEDEAQAFKEGAAPPPAPLATPEPLAAITDSFRPVGLPGRIQSENLTVVFTDIKDFTARTSRQTREENRRILELHERLLQPVFEGYRGRVVKTIGDAFLVVFSSPTNAVLCAMAVQDRLAEHNAAAPAVEKLDVRVAINLGEVTQSKGDIFGDPVNVAARLEGITEAGEIYFTEAVYLAMNRSEVPFELVGTREMRGVDIAIKVYRVKRDPSARLPFGGAALEPLREHLRRVERREMLARRFSEGRQAWSDGTRRWGEQWVDAAVNGPPRRRAQAIGLAAVIAVLLGGASWGAWRWATRTSGVAAQLPLQASSPRAAPSPRAAVQPAPPPAPAEPQAAAVKEPATPGSSAAAEPAQANPRHRTPADDFQSFMDDLIPPKHRAKKRSTGRSEDKGTAR